MPRGSLTRGAVVDAAYDVAAKVGYDRFTVADVARHLGVSVPNIYKHAAGLDDLRRTVARAVMKDCAAVLSRAATGRSGAEALTAVAAAYRAFAVGHPHVYAATQLVPDGADAEHQEAADSAVATLAAVLRGYGLSEERLIDAVRAVRSMLHGYVALELAGGFELPRDMDESFRYAVQLLDAGLSVSAG